MKGAAAMGRKLTLRELAMNELGDFSNYVGEDAIRAKMADIYAKEAKERGEDENAIALARALIERDGNLDALGRKDTQIYEWGGESFLCDLPSVIREATKEAPKGGKKEAPKRAKEKPIRRNSHIKAAEMEAPKKEEKRGRGRPRKYDGAARQTSILFDDATRAAVMQYAKYWRVSFSDAVNKLIRLGMRK